MVPITTSPYGSPEQDPFLLLEFSLRCTVRRLPAMATLQQRPVGMHGCSWPGVWASSGTGVPQIPKAPADPATR